MENSNSFKKGFWSIWDKMTHFQLSKTLLIQAISNSWRGISWN